MTSILLVEDNDDERDLLTQLLEAQGFEVSGAKNFESAYRLLSDEAFDSVITDLDLGGRGGLDVCEAVAQLQPGLPVLVVTGHGSLSAAISALRSGAYDFITKPIDPQLVEVSLRRAVEDWRLMVELRVRGRGAARRDGGVRGGACGGW
jgi:DNA-binding NtrC family response regulator